MTTLEDQAERARLANSVLQNSAYNESFQAVSDGLMDLWKRTGVSETEVREKIYLSYQLLLRVRQELEKVIQGGKLAEAEIVQLQKRKGLFR